MQVRITTESVGPATVVHVAGEVDLHTAPELQRALLTPIADGDRRIVVDLTEVDFLDSTGLSAILQGVSEVEASGGDLSVVTAAEKITKVFTLTGLDRRIRLFGSVTEALAAL